MKVCPITDSTVTDGLGPVCVDLEGPNVNPRPAAATAIVECWDWSADASQDTCQDKNGVSQFGDWGVYYCPPRGAHAPCDENGSPTTGTIDLAINKQPSETVAFWCAEFSGGRFSDECTAERNDTDCDRIKAGKPWKAARSREPSAATRTSQPCRKAAKA